jgi:transmembrane sensor
MNPERYTTYKADDFIFDEEFRELVRKPNSDVLINEFIELMPEKRYEINLAVQVIQSLHVTKFQQSTQRKNELWSEIANRKKKHFNLAILKYAAVFILLLGSASTFYLLNYSAQKVIVAKVDNSNDTKLVLANGQTIHISSKESNIKYSADGSGVMVNDSSDVAQSVMGFNKMIVPYGKRSILTLSDGTKVWLNSGSTLVFPPVFKGKTREVILVGEAFFDVTHNKEKPFFVKTDAFKMKVYGTKFDVKAYQQDKEYDIVLVEGKVSMNSNVGPKTKEVFLAPNQKATISRGEKEFDITTVKDMETYTSWIDGYMAFSNADILDLLKQVSRYYKADIEVEFPGNMEKIYGKLDLKDDLTKVLDGVAFISKTNYRKVGNKYIFYESKNK